MRATLLFALLLALAAAAPAAAAGRIDLGPGQAPSVVVDRVGTAHIFFRTPGSPSDGATYCRLPRNATACDVRTFMPLASMQTSRILQRASDGVLIALQTDNRMNSVGNFGTLWASYSADNGTTFTPPLAIDPNRGTAEPAALAPDAGSVFSLAFAADGLQLRRSSFDGIPDPRVLLLDETASSASEHATLAVLPDGRMLAAQETGGNVRWRLFSGGDPFDVNTWPKRGTLRGQSAPVLAAGPRGVVLLDDRSVSDEQVDGAAPFGLRVFDANRLRWLATRTAGADQAGYGASDLAQDERGRLHLVSTSGNAEVGGCVLYSRTGTRSSQWFGRTTILFRTRVDARKPAVPAVAAAPDGRGVAVWDDTSNVWVSTLKQAKGRYRPIANGFRRPICGRR